MQRTETTDTLVQPEKEVTTQAESSEETSAQTEPSQAIDPELEKTKQMIARWAERGHKPILFDPPLSDTSSRIIQDAQAQLATLKEKIAAIHATVNEQHTHITQRLGKLKDNPVLTVDTENKQANESVTQYSKLLDRIVQEVEYEHSQLQRYADLDTKTALPVPFHEPDNFDGFIRSKVNRVKKQVKKIHRDLDVSSSRYSFSFEKQCKNLENIEAMVAYNLKLREIQEQQKGKELAEKTD